MPLHLNFLYWTVKVNNCLACSRIEESIENGNVCKVDKRTGFNAGSVALSGNFKCYNYDLDGTKIQNLTMVSRFECILFVVHSTVTPTGA